jgi:hypothetical protein
MTESLVAKTPVRALTARIHPSFESYAGENDSGGWIFRTTRAGARAPNGKQRGTLDGSRERAPARLKRLVLTGVRT